MVVYQELIPLWQELEPTCSRLGVKTMDLTIPLLVIMKEIPVRMSYTFGGYGNTMSPDSLKDGSRHGFKSNSLIPAGVSSLVELQIP